MHFIQLLGLAIAVPAGGDIMSSSLAFAPNAAGVFGTERLLAMLAVHHAWNFL